VVGGHPRFRKLDDREMKRRKTGEFVRVGARLPHGVHSEAARGCGKRLPGVQSAVKSRPDARCEEPGFAHGIHPGAFPGQANVLIQNWSHSELLLGAFTQIS